MNNSPVILFDGVCNLCNGAVQFVIKHDEKGQFRFASLQGEHGQQLLKQYNLSRVDLDSFVLIQGDVAYSKSTAALLVAKQLKGVVKSLYVFRIIPAFIRDGIYNFIARNRYRWFGRKESCMIPSVDLRARFLN
jgi:predicted DCC family thiol-disulfide oxidoreductase YuxK